MSIETLKEQARRHEQKEEWQKALDQYKKAISQLEAEDQPDIGLYNRVGDLFVRVGNLAGAVEHYDRAVDLYLESELPNNAIAVCKKIIRNVPARHQAYLRIGQIRAGQGFISDARTNFLTYAERMQEAENIDESFRALIEFCDLAPDDVELRLLVADQMKSRDRTDDAVQQLSQAYRALMHRGRTAQAARLEEKIREFDPTATFATTSAVAEEPEGDLMISGSSLADESGIASAFGEVEIDQGVEASEEEAAEGEAAQAGPGDLPGFVIESMEGLESTTVAGSDASFERQDETDDIAFELPGLDFGDGDPVEGDGDKPEGDDEGTAFDLPLLDFGVDDELGDADGVEDEGKSEAVDLPLMYFGEEGGDASSTPETIPEGPDITPEVQEATEGTTDDATDDTTRDAPVPVTNPVVVPAIEPETPVTLDAVRSRIADAPDDIALRQRFVEVAYQSGDERALVEAYLGLGDTLQRAGQLSRAKAAYQQVLQFDPSNEAARAGLGHAPVAPQPVKEVAAHEDYVDLGALILGDETEKTTRFVVAYEEPSGDEQADFAKMLSQFKAKVSENLDADDVRSHHDLGTAYKEMGLLDEAVSEFQQALRASPGHLPTYEMLGHTFTEMGKPEAAIRSLRRAIEVGANVEDELIGIYYYLACAYETVGNKEQAMEFYDRVFSLDINFADVTERLRTLR